MPERKGTVFVRLLFNKPVATSLEEWHRFDQSYPEALNILANAESKRINLVELDDFVHIKLPSLVRSREPPHLLHSELSQVMAWKLTRGKFRPLQKLVESNSAMSVMDASAKAFHQLFEGNWEEAFDSITQLRGVGVATASAIFATLAPESCPFMADEILEGVTSEGRQYSMNAYFIMRNALLSKAKELGEREWTAERVGRALWTCAIISANEITQAALDNKKKNANERVNRLKRKETVSSEPSSSSSDQVEATSNSSSTTTGKKRKVSSK